MAAAGIHRLLFQFPRGRRLAAFPSSCSLISLGLIAGLAVMAALVEKNSRVLFAVLSFYSLIVVRLAPVFIWNLIYLIFNARRTRSLTRRNSQKRLNALT